MQLWTFSDDFSEYRVELTDQSLRWDTSYNDDGRPHSETDRQSLSSFLERGPILTSWPFFKTVVPLDITDAISAAGGQPRPAWVKELSPPALQLFEAANAGWDCRKKIEELLKQGAPVDEMDGFGFTPLWHAGHFGDQESTCALLRGGAEPRRILEGVRGYETVFHAAASRGYNNIIEELTRRKVTANLLNAHEENAFFFVQLEPALNRHTSSHVTRALLAGGADPNQVSANGETPLQYSRRRGLKEMEQLLLAAGAK